MEGREWRCPNGCPTKGEVESHKKAVVHFEAEGARLRASSVTLQGALDEALGEVGRLKADLAAFKNPGDHFAWQEARARLLSDCDSLRASLESADKMLVSVKCAVQALKGCDSPLWTHFDGDALETALNHDGISDPATYTAVFAADELDKIEREIDAYLAGRNP